jgi:hypothetical protein
MESKDSESLIRAFMNSEAIIGLNRRRKVAEMFSFQDQLVLEVSMYDENNRLVDVIQLSLDNNGLPNPQNTVQSLIFAFETGLSHRRMLQIAKRLRRTTFLSNQKLKPRNEHAGKSNE